MFVLWIWELGLLEIRGKEIRYCYEFWNYSSEPSVDWGLHKARKASFGASLYLQMVWLTGFSSFFIALSFINCQMLKLLLNYNIFACKWIWTLFMFYFNAVGRRWDPYCWKFHKIQKLVPRWKSRKFFMTNQILVMALKRKGAIWGLTHLGMSFGIVLC